MNCPHGRPDKAACPHCCFQSTLIEGDAKDARIAELEAENAALRTDAHDRASDDAARIAELERRVEALTLKAFTIGVLQSCVASGVPGSMYGNARAELDRYAKAIGGSDV